MLSLTTLDLSSWDTSHVVQFQGMFGGCSNLSNLNLGNNFDTSSAYYMYGMFSGCKSLTTIDISNFNFSQARQINQMFRNCTNVTGSSNMFTGATNLVGGNGTTYSSSNPTDKTYAVIDTVSTPGYFTYKAPTINNTSSNPITSLFKGIRKALGF